MTTHQEKVRKVAQQIQSLNAMGGGGVEFEKSSVSHLVPNPYRGKRPPRIDLKDLREIIEIDTENRTCTAESGIPFVDLARETLKHGLIPHTVPKLKTITIGGAVSGCSVEAMSYKYGGFHDSCLEYEAVTGKGEIVTCSPGKDPDLFHMLHGSYGTLAVITQIKFKLLPAKPFVKMEYRRHEDFKSYWADLQERCDKDDYDFVDGIIHGRDKFVICLGTMVDEAPYTSNYEWLNIYYKSTLAKREDYLTTHHYFFRYDAECHWLSKSVPPLEWKPVRFLAGKLFLGSSNLIAWSDRLRSIMRMKKRPEVIVDVFIPSARFEEFFRWYETDFDFFPLWIVPYRSPEIYPWVADEHQKKMGDGFFIDCAVYGKINNDKEIDYSELLENKTIELGGIKTLISRNHFDKETFWSVYSKPRWQAAKDTLDPDNLFGDLFEKFAPEKYQKK